MSGSNGVYGWKWFPIKKDGWSLDVVGLLAVIGESSLEEHSQTITASLLGTLPRIIPAPQALLKPSRPARMPETRAKMTGVYSGFNLESVGFFANIITPLDDLPPYSFKVIHIRHSSWCDEKGGGVVAPPRLPATDHRSVWWLRRVLRARAWRPPRNRAVSNSELDDVSSRQPADDEESARGGGPARQSASKATGAAVGGNDGEEYVPKHLMRRETAKSRAQDVLANGTLAVTDDRPAIPAKLFSPIHVLSVLSCALSLAIIIAAGIWQDGVAIISVGLLSLVGSIVGFASSWRPLLMKRKHTNEVPKGDVMIRTREGAFVLVQCTEEVARELYSGTEECDYRVNGRTYRLLMGLGTILLMLGIVLVGNCTWNSQLFIGGSYVVLNGLYWGCGMLPRSYFWDLSRYTWEVVTPDESANAHETTDEDDQREGHPSFTRTLWYAIRATKETSWVELNGAAPGTEQWYRWLREAEENARRGNVRWPAVKRKDEILKEKSSKRDVLSGIT